MWVITLYSQDGIKLFEFDSMEEAKEKFNKVSGNKILSQVIYYNDFEQTALQ